MAKYPLFKDVPDTLNKVNPAWKNEIRGVLARQFARKDCTEFTLSEHIEGVIFAGLSSMRGWAAVENARPMLNKVFFDFDIDKLKNANAKELSDSVKALKAGTFRINYQMRALKTNIETLERIAKAHESIDKYYNKFCALDDIEEKIKLVTILSSKDYKLKELGIPLVCEYIKGMGVDIVKPDRHVCRILMRMGYVNKSLAKNKNKLFIETIRVCDEIAKEYGLTNAEVDTILWQYCADDYTHICTAVPQCNKCGACHLCPKVI